MRAVIISWFCGQPPLGLTVSGWLIMTAEARCQLVKFFSVHYAFKFHHSIPLMLIRLLCPLNLWAMSIKKTEDPRVVNTLFLRLTKGCIYWFRKNKTCRPFFQYAYFKTFVMPFLQLLCLIQSKICSIFWDFFPIFPLDLANFGLTRFRLHLLFQFTRNKIIFN